jgi:hypothetical protein
MDLNEKHMRRVKSNVFSSVDSLDRKQSFIYKCVLFIIWSRFTWSLLTKTPFLLGSKPCFRVLCGFSDVTLSYEVLHIFICRSRSQWPRDLRHRPWSPKRWDRGFEFRLSHGCFKSSFCIVFSVVLCVGRGLCDGLITSHKESYQVLKTSSVWGGQFPFKDCRDTEEDFRSRPNSREWNRSVCFLYTMFLSVPFHGSGA